MAAARLDCQVQLRHGGPGLNRVGSTGRAIAAHPPDFDAPEREVQRHRHRARAAGRLRAQVTALVSGHEANGELTRVGPSVKLAPMMHPPQPGRDRTPTSATRPGSESGPAPTGPRAHWTANRHRTRWRPELPRRTRDRVAPPPQIRDRRQPLEVGLLELQAVPEIRGSSDKCGPESTLHGQSAAAQATGLRH